jgi:ribokinase
VIDLAVASPAFLDITFIGLSGLPVPGEEHFATDLHHSPGGGAITATGAARLGLDVTLAAPLGDDDTGARIRAALERDGVACVPAHPGATAITVVLPVSGDRAMITYNPGARVRPGELEELAPRAVVCGLEQLGDMPAASLVYASLGDGEARAYAGLIAETGRLPERPDSAPSAQTLFVNEAEARILTGMADPEAAATALGALVETVVVTVGPRGAIAFSDGQLTVAPGVTTGPAVDTTGAGDLFVAAYVWADLQGADLAARLDWAVLYAALSVTTATGTGGAGGAAELMEEGTRRGLPKLAAAATGVPRAQQGEER